MWVIMIALCKQILGFWSRDQILQAKMGKKLTNSNRYISVIADIDEKWLVIFKHIINHLSFSYGCLP